jgi:hypothetical protein
LDAISCGRVLYCNLIRNVGKLCFRKRTSETMILFPYQRADALEARTSSSRSFRDRNCKTLTQWPLQLACVAAGFLFALLIFYERLTQRYVLLSICHRNWLNQHGISRPEVSNHSISDLISISGNDKISNLWGQYSPFFEVRSDISTNLPNSCHYTFAQLLSRHGARYPTALKSWSYQTLISRIKAEVDSFYGRYTFLKDYSYEGYHEASLIDDPDRRNPAMAVIISDEDGSNNTLNITTCPAFGRELNSEVGSHTKATWATTFVPAIMGRLNRDLAGLNLTIGGTTELMDLCPFETSANSNSTTTHHTFHTSHYLTA